MPLTTGWEDVPAVDSRCLPTGFSSSAAWLPVAVWLGRTPDTSPSSQPCSLQMLRLFCSSLPSAHRKQNAAFSSLLQAADEDLMSQNYKPALKNTRIPHNHIQQDSHVGRDALFTSSPSLLLSSLPTQPLCRKLQS